MNEKSARNWIIKAENDLKTGKDEIRTENPATDTVCFHMQQCTEKYLKAFLVFHGKEIKKTHNIEEILKECINISPDFQNLLDINAGILTDYAVEFRYPADILSPSIEEARQAIEIAEKVKEFVLKKLKEYGFKY